MRSSSKERLIVDQFETRAAHVCPRCLATAESNRLNAIAGHLATPANVRSERMRRVVNARWAKERAAKQSEPKEE